MLVLDRCEGSHRDHHDELIHVAGSGGIMIIICAGPALESMPPRRSVTNVDDYTGIDIHNGVRYLLAKREREE